MSFFNAISRQYNAISNAVRCFFHRLLLLASLAVLDAASSYQNDEFDNCSNGDDRQADPDAE
jgi:hypothetical protein